MIFDQNMHVSRTGPRNMHILYDQNHNKTFGWMHEPGKTRLNHNVSRTGPRHGLPLLMYVVRIFIIFQRMIFFENIRNAKNINLQRKKMSGTGPRHIMVWAIFSRSCIHPQNLIVILIIYKMHVPRTGPRHVCMKYIKS